MVNYPIIFKYQKCEHVHHVTLLSCVHMINGCLVGPPVMTHVKFKVDPLLRKTSEDPRMVVLGSEMITILMNSKNGMYLH